MSLRVDLETEDKEEVGVEACGMPVPVRVAERLWNGNDIICIMDSDLLNDIPLTVSNLGVESEVFNLFLNS